MDESSVRRTLAVMSRDDPPASGVVVETALVRGRRAAFRRRVTVGVAGALALVVVVAGGLWLGRTPPTVNARLLFAITLRPTPTGPGFAYLDGNTVVLTDGARTDLDAPTGTQVSAATVTGAGVVFWAVGQTGTVYLQPGAGSAQPVPGGDDGFAVSSDGTRVALMGPTDVTVRTLPGLRLVGTYPMRETIPNGAMVIGYTGDWILVFDGDEQQPVTVAWNVSTGASTRTTGVYPFAIAPDGRVLRRVDGSGCYDLAPLAGAGASTGHCVERPAGGNDTGTLSPDGHWATLQWSDREPAVLVRTADLHDGDWRPITLPDGVPLFWTSATSFILRGAGYSQCDIAGHCAAIPVPATATIVPVLAP